MRDPESTAPEHSEPAPDATLRLSIGQPSDPNVTQRIPLPGSTSDQTLKFSRPVGGEPPIRLQKLDEPAEAAGQTQKQLLRPESPRPIAWKVPLALGILVVVGAAAYLVSSRGPAPHPAPSAPLRPEAAPAGAQVYLEQAKAGDAHAMRMLGVMYYYGLNVPQDREKGLYWYRKAAERGSDAARIELGKLEAAK
jgi:hypothetical protein